MEPEQSEDATDELEDVAEGVDDVAEAGDLLSIMWQGLGNITERLFEYATDNVLLATLILVFSVFIGVIWTQYRKPMLMGRGKWRIRKEAFVCAGVCNAIQVYAFVETLPQFQLFTVALMTSIVAGASTEVGYRLFKNWLPRLMPGAKDAA